MILKKGLILAILATFCLASTLLHALPIGSPTTDGEYDPWVDTNDDGMINYQDLGNLATRFGTSGTPINKTDLLLELNATVEELLSRVESLEAPGSVTTEKIANETVTNLKLTVDAVRYTSINSSETTGTLSTDYEEILDMSVNITLSRRSRLIIMFSAVVGVLFADDVIVVRALVNETVADPGDIVFFHGIAESTGHRHWLGFAPYSFNFVQLSEPGAYTVKIEWKASEGGGAYATERTLVIIALPA